MLENHDHAHRQVLTGRHYKNGLPIRITVEDGIIADIQKVKAEGTDSWGWIGPGFTDLQINGFRNDDFNSRALKVEDVIRMTRRLWHEGVTTYYPTIITNHDDAIRHNVSCIYRACLMDASVRSCIGGVHLEGPFISIEDGARGAHPRQHVLAPDWDLFAKWQEAAGGLIHIITLSPEWEESIPFIRRCVDEGVKVAIGHTSATPEQIRAAVEAGACMSTHFGNGAHMQLPRHPNYLWEQLAQDELWACAIADGFHLPYSVLKVLKRVKEEKMVLVSDAVRLSGMPPGEYQDYIGGEVILTPEGKLHIKDNPLMLAGSVSMLRHGIAHMERSGICDLAAAWDMASTSPSMLMGLATGTGMTVGGPADLIQMAISEGESEPLILACYKRGIQVYAK